MTKALFVTSSATGGASVSNRLANGFAEALGGEVVMRDVGRDPLPHLTVETVSAIRGTATSAAERETLALSDALVAELEAAELIVIASPMYNFGMASTLKVWFDHVLRAGVTFRYTEAGSQGLLKGKRAIVILTRAGVYSEGAAAAMDGQEPHIRTLLGFMGIDDVTFVRAERLAFGPESQARAIAGAVRELGAIARNPIPLAA